MRWGIAVEEPEGAYEGISNDEGIDKQNRALEITDQYAEELQEALRDELGGQWKAESGQSGPNSELPVEPRPPWAPPRPAYPPGSPCRFDHWDEMLAKLDETCQRLRIKLSPDSEAMWQLERIRQEFGHVARYARDGESGQVALLAVAEAAQEVGDYEDDHTTGPWPEFWRRMARLNREVR